MSTHGSKFSGKLLQWYSIMDIEIRYNLIPYWKDDEYFVSRANWTYPFPFRSTPVAFSLSGRAHDSRNYRKHHRCTRGDNSSRTQMACLSLACRLGTVQFCPFSSVLYRNCYIQDTVAFPELCDRSFQLKTSITWRNKTDVMWCNVGDVTCVLKSHC